MNRRVLCVDDEPAVLAAHKRTLRGQFDVAVADSGPQALQTLAQDGPFAVVLSDMRMPGMDGVELLTRVCKAAPQTIRMMLTGNGDLDTAVEAVNRGRIFRFLTKPCRGEDLLGALEAGVEQHRLVHAERELLHNTLTGSIKVLAEMLSLVNPVAFSRSMRVRHYVREIARRLGLEALWQIDLAAMLSQLGCITIPAETLQRVEDGAELDPQEQQMLAEHPGVGARLIEKIPRLQGVARMIERQGQPPEDPDDPRGQILPLVLEFDRRIRGGVDAVNALTQLREAPGPWGRALLDTLAEIVTEEAEELTQRQAVEVTVAELETGMVTCDEVRAANGLLLAPPWQEITETILRRLRNFRWGVGVVEPLRVWKMK